MSELNVFAFDSHAVRVMMVDGEPWFVAADVCAALTIGNSRDALMRLDDDEKGVGSIDTLGGIQDMNTVNESGLYSLILGSRKPEAKRFKKWVTAEVLPSIRKTGRYIHGAATATAVPRIPSHEADRIVTASRTFNALLRAGQGARLPLATAIRRAAEVAQRETGVNLLDELQAHDHVHGMEARAVAAQQPSRHAGAARFWQEWASGQIEGLPYQTCLCAQAYAAYTHWCSLMREGETSRREVFTATLLDVSAQAGQPVRVKPMNIGPRSAVKTERVLLITPPPMEGQGVWATALVQQFEEPLRAFLARKR